MRYKNVLMDFDGTVARTGDGIINGVKYACETMGFIEGKPWEDWRRYIGPTVYRFTQSVLDLDDDGRDEFMRLYKMYYKEHGIAEGPLYPGMGALIADLRKSGAKVFICSSKPEELCYLCIDYLKVTFDGVVAMVPNRVTKNEVIDFCLKEYGLDPCECVMIGDRDSDVICGKALGCAGIGVTYGYGSFEEMNGCGADYVANDVYELRKILMGVDNPMRIPKYENVLLDFDGTMVDTGPGITYSLGQASKIMDIELPLHETWRYIGPPFSVFMKDIGIPDDTAAKLVAEYRKNYDVEGKYKSTPYAGIKELVHELRQNGARVFVATSKPEYMTVGMMADFGIESDGICGAIHDIGRVDKADVIRDCSEIYGFPLDSRTVMVGDAPRDITAGRECGVDTLGIYYGYGVPEKLDEALPNMKAETVAKLRELLYNK